MNEQIKSFYIMATSLMYRQTQAKTDYERDLLANEIDYFLKFANRMLLIGMKVPNDEQEKFISEVRDASLGIACRSFYE
jgi:hypothetical protein